MMNQVIDFFKRFFDTSDWPPRWHCGKWTEFHGWLYIISDLLIWSAYFTIPIVILRFVSRKQGIKFEKLYFLFAAFILACGATHFLDALAFWLPAYRVNALVRLITGVISWVTVFYLVKLLPVVFALRTQKELEVEIEQRKSAEEQFRSLLDGAPDAILLVDQKGIIQMVNKQTENLFGYARTEIIGLPIDKLVPPSPDDSYPAKSNIFMNAADLSPTGNVIEFNAVKKGGIKFPAEINLSPLASEEGSLISASVRDISAQKLLRAEVNHLASMVEQSSEAIISLGLNQKFISWNKGAEVLFGYSKSEAVGKTPAEIGFVKFTDEELNLIQREVFEKGNWKSERTFYHRNATSFFGSVTGNLIKNEQGKVVSFYFIVKDISTRKEFELKLQKHNEELEENVKIRTEEINRSEKKYRYLFENNPMPMWIMDLKTFKFLDVNQMATIQYGYSRNEFLSMTAVDIRPEGDKEIFKQSDHTFNHNEKTYNKGIWSHVKKDGTIIQVEIIGHKIIFEGAEARFILANDVTERVKAEKKLVISEKRFRTLIENISDAIVVNDADSNILYQSPSVEKILGYKPEEREGKKVLQYVHPDYKTEFLNLYEQLKNTPGKPFPFEYQFLHKNGKYIWLEGVVTNLLNDPAVNAYVANYRDITGRKEAEQQLIKSEKIYKTIASSIPGSVICLLDKDYRYLLIEGDMIEKLGYSKDALLGGKAIDVLPPEIFEEIEPDFIKVFQGETVNKENHRNGYDILSRYIPLKDDTNNVYAMMTVSIDITQLKNAQRDVSELNKDLEEKIAKRTEQLKKANEELEAFSYSVSHDLRAPLRAIVGFTAILEEEYVSKLDDEAKRISGIIKASTLKMGTLIDDLLSFSRMSRHELTKSTVNMQAMVQDVINSSDGTKIKNTEWKIHTLPAIEADVNTIRQVWINLIGNAIKYSGKIEHPIIEIGAYTEPGQIVYFVKDNGAGFDEKYKHKLFKVFQRLHSNDQFEGTGIGLAIIEKIVSKHGGNVWAEGTKNAGASFYFSLPLPETLNNKDFTHH
jgi:PAS domain S-box-containing protein